MPSGQTVQQRIKIKGKRLRQRPSEIAFQTAFAVKTQTLGFNVFLFELRLCLILIPNQNKNLLPSKQVFNLSHSSRRQRRAFRMLVAVVHKQILFRKTAYPIFGIFINNARVVLLIAVQFAAQRLDMQDKAFTVGQTLAAEK